MLHLKRLLAAILGAAFVLSTVSIVTYVNLYKRFELPANRVLILLQAYAFSAQIVFAVIFLFLIGITLSVLIGKDTLWFSHLRYPFGHCVFIGQLLLFFYVYVRSLVNCFIGFVVPITIVDAMLMLIALWFLLFRKGKLKSLLLHLYHGRYFYGSAILLLWLFLLIVSANELPRLNTLSSDPDIHAFMARQVDRFGTVPYFHQFYWGKTSYWYPWGFAVLNYIWTELSGLDIRNVVTIQYVAQVLLGILVIVEISIHRKTALGKSHCIRLFTIFLAFCAYFFLTPFGYDDSHYHLEGTGRLSSMFFLSVPFSMLAGLIGPSRIRDRTALFPYTVVLFLTLVACTLMNPINIVYTAAFGCIGIATHLIRNRAWSRIYLPVVAFGLFFLVFVDPYYIHGLASRSRRSDPVELQTDTTISDTQDSARAVTRRFPLIGDYCSRLRETISNRQAYRECFSFSVFARDGDILLFSALVLIHLVVSVASAKRFRSILGSLTILVVPFILLLSYLLLTSSLELLKPSLGHYSLMVDRYVRFLHDQYLFFCLIHLLVISIPPAMFHMTMRKAAFPLILTCAVICLLPGSIREKHISPRVSLRWLGGRKYYAGSMGKAVDDDIAVIRKIEKEFGDYLAENRRPDSCAIPKILIANLCHTTSSGERWLFPHGASRMLPLYDVFPVAFFYYQGSNDYNWKSYKAHIADRLDLEWLKEMNIKYLFIPTYNGRATQIAGFHDLPERCRIVFRKGQCMFLELL